MLVLSRKKGQRIRIGEDIELVITDIRGDRVKLGFRAPSHVAIHRDEVYRRISGEITLPAESPRAASADLIRRLA